MKKIVLFLMPLLLLSCNNTKEDEPKEPEKEKYYELWFYPSNYYDLTLYFSMQIRHILFIVLWSMNQ